MSNFLPWVLPEDLEELRRDEPETITAILESFIVQMHSDLEHLSHQLAIGAERDAARAVHKIKGSLLVVGADDLATSCKAFELAIPVEVAEQRQQRLLELKAGCAALENRLQALLKE